MLHRLLDDESNMPYRVSFIVCGKELEDWDEEEDAQRTTLDYTTYGYVVFYLFVLAILKKSAGIPYLTRLPRPLPLPHD